jgi:hypothetical protein
MSHNPDNLSPLYILESEMRDLAYLDFAFKKGEADSTYFDISSGDKVPDPDTSFDRHELDYKFSAVRYRSLGAKAMVRFSFGLTLTSENSKAPLPVAVRALMDNSEDIIDPGSAQDQLGLVTFEKSLTFTYFTDRKILHLCEMYEYKDEDGDTIVMCCACEDNGMHDEDGEVIDYNVGSVAVLDELKESAYTDHEKVEFDDIESALDYWYTETIAASMLKKTPEEQARDKDERTLLGLAVLRATRHALHSKAGFNEHSCHLCRA